MAYSEILAGRVEEALRKIKKVKTQKMMGGLCFMVNGKMALAVMAEDLLVRVGPEARAKALKRKDCREEGFKGRPMKAFVFVGPKGTKTDKDLRSWVDLALAYNPSAKASKE
jgi:TfoX/Sxy family transcriptional regulator of competence genes